MAVNLLTRFLRIQPLKRALSSVSSLNVAPQQRAALAEQCIVVDVDDTAVGAASKLDCHRVRDGKLILHRAFSVFLFNTRGELLLQRRSADKVTYPGCYTNACCSHPLVDFPCELEEKEAIGVRLAAQRRLGHELGVPEIEARPELMTYLTRIHYLGVESLWGEHEIDYILVLQGDVTLRPNPEEVSEVRYISRDQLKPWLKEERPELTPWFRLIVKHKLFDWWDNLDRLDQFKDHKNIARFC